MIINDGTMKKASYEDYHSYLDNPNDSTYFFAGREYLKDLPVRPTKRKRADIGASTTTTTPSSGDATISWFDSLHTSSFVLKGHIVHVNFLSTITLLAAAVLA
eukprot:CAMPEP_0172324236 /NCGR_PEP_ID=MMETSP1058-20130122/50814_1 /TAXON_ID=83371 /ORGANISM="Detonula confervacea, Strain CCMP 353" /LENGTH=102 /DNA_ID=CAMNT_0013040443 /DNA_START=1 /DNA_END=306 /DNA_ORIENTATION=+